ncbi:MAG: 7-cyano-7-deazaguanine synthase [Planctomycetota bacterium]|nr:7-cyano-7-deazaguanine synthase [Planctomycetota bacterium]
MAKDLAIVLNNGSINSAVVTAMASQRYRPIMVLCDTAADQGGRLRWGFDQQVAYFKPYRDYSVPMSFAAGASNASATIADPRQTAPLGPQMLHFLPLIATAVRLAVHHQVNAVYLGLRVGPGTEELAQATEYIQIWNELVQLPCGQAEMEILTPLLELEPWQVVDVGFSVAAPLERTWSCIEESSEPCWGCRGCKTREAAFQQAGKPDPLRIAKRI